MIRIREQYELSTDDVGDTPGYITPDDTGGGITFYEGKPVGMTLPSPGADLHLLRTRRQGRYLRQDLQARDPDTASPFNVPLFCTSAPRSIGYRDGTFIEGLYKT
jgi:hypothetical protein